MQLQLDFPLFTLGGLIFAAIWAQIAWDRFWGWDPKEVWALDYMVFLCSISYIYVYQEDGMVKSQHGLAVIGFAIIMFNLIVVNLVLAGLHSYA